MIGEPLVFREEVDSTNTLARQLAEEGATHGTAVRAARQTAGRGRRGRSWLTLPGDHVYLSVIVRPQLPPERVPELTLIAAVAVAEALERFGVPARIKWPNDVQSRGRKISGILSELTAEASGEVRYVILGIGVNVTTPAEEFPQEIRDIAASVLAETGQVHSSEVVAAAILERLDHWMQQPSAVALDAWRAKSSTLGQQVRALMDGREIVGLAESIDDTGALIVASSDGRRHRVIAGEVTNLRRAMAPDNGHEPR